MIFISSAAVLNAQTIQMQVVNGKTGRPITHIPWLSPRTILDVTLGRDSDLSLVLTADRHGVVSLRFTRKTSEINVPDCKGEHAAGDKLVKNPNKKDQQDFNDRYKNCTHFPVDHPVVSPVDSISIGSIVRTLNGATYFSYIQCWAPRATVFSTDKVLQHGIVTTNNCGKATAPPQPGHLVLFVRSPTQMEAGRQAWN